MTAHATCVEDLGGGPGSRLQPGWSRLGCCVEGSKPMNERVLSLPLTLCLSNIYLKNSWSCDVASLNFPLSRTGWLHPIS